MPNEANWDLEKEVHEIARHVGWDDQREKVYSEILALCARVAEDAVRRERESLRKLMEDAVPLVGYIPYKENDPSILWRVNNWLDRYHTAYTEKENL